MLSSIMGAPCFLRVGGWSRCVHSAYSRGYQCSTIYSRRNTRREKEGPGASLGRPQPLEIHPPGAMVELVVQVHRRVDEREVGECLREVPLLPTGESNLLREQAQVVGVGIHFLEREPCFLQPI